MWIFLFHIQNTYMEIERFLMNKNTYLENKSLSVEM